MLPFKQASKLSEEDADGTHPLPVIPNVAGLLSPLCLEAEDFLQHSSR